MPCSTCSNSFDAAKADHLVCLKHFFLLEAVSLYNTVHWGRLRGAPSDQLTVADYAVFGRSAQCLEFALQKGCAPTEEMMNECAMGNFPEGMRCLMKYNSDTLSFDMHLVEECIRVATETGDASCFRCSLEFITTHGWPRELAVDEGEYPAYEFVKSSAQDLSVICSCAALHDNLQCLKIAHEEFNIGMHKPSWTALCCKSAECLQYVVDAGSDIANEATLDSVDVLTDPFYIWMSQEPSVHYFVPKLMVRYAATGNLELMKCAVRNSCAPVFDTFVADVIKIASPTATGWNDEHRAGGFTAEALEFILSLRKPTEDVDGVKIAKLLSPSVTAHELYIHAHLRKVLAEKAQYLELRLAQALLEALRMYKAAEKTICESTVLPRDVVKYEVMSFL